MYIDTKFSLYCTTQHYVQTIVSSAPREKHSLSGQS